MKNILLIQSSPRGSESYSQRVANSIVNEIKDRHLSTTITFRDLAEDQKDQTQKEPTDVS